MVKYLLKYITLKLTFKLVRIYENLNNKTYCNLKACRALHTKHNE